MQVADERGRETSAGCAERVAEPARSVERLSTTHAIAPPFKLICEVSAATSFRAHSRLVELEVVDRHEGLRRELRGQTEQAGLDAPPR